MILLYSNGCRAFYSIHTPTSPLVEARGILSGVPIIVTKQICSLSFWRSHSRSSLVN